MAADIADSTARRIDLASRRLAVGLGVSLLLHAVLLSLQFGLPARAIGELKRFTVSLRPVVQAPVEVAPVPALPETVAPPPATPPGVTASAGLRVVGIAPSKPPQQPTARASRKRKPATRISRQSPRPQPPALRERVIASEQQTGSFSVPQPEPAAANERTSDPLALQQGTDAGTGTAADDGQGQLASAQEQARQRENEELRQRAEEARRQAELDRIAAQRQAEEELARRRDEERIERALDEQRQQQRMAAEALSRKQEEERQAAEALARAQASQRAAQEQSRLLAQQQRDAQELLERHRREEEMRRAERAERELAARRQEELRQAELRRQEPERLAAQQEAERQRQAEEAARRLAEQAARRQAEQLAQQRRAQELARQQEQLANRQIATEPAASIVSAGAPGGEAAKGLGGAGPGGSGTVLSRNALGSDMANRARELVRGIGVLGGTPPAARQPEEGQSGKRRIVSAGAERDVPLRMYIDSFRQKIERNGTLNGGQLAADRVRVDPVVSVAIRADGSIEEVLIVRSSGRSELDEAVRRVVRLNARYAVFPPNVAAHYDVIEIRRIWTFANGLKLLEELR